MSTDLRTTPRMNDTSMAPTGTRGRTLTIIGFVCAALALFILPIVFGPAAIVLGIVGWRQGDSLGVWAAVAGAVALVAGLVIAAMVFAANDAASSA